MNDRYEEPQAAPPYYSGSERRTSTLAIVSLVTGILGWTAVPFLGSIIAIITGHMAKKEIQENSASLSGDGLATAGLVLGYTAIALGLLAVCCAALFFLTTAGLIFVGSSAILPVFAVL